tara:strand:- start:96 stop:380 length:285 start_codon:yes stop_codon:yes gene_type:complete
MQMWGEDMIQWTIRKILWLMGHVYVVLDKRLKHNTEVILDTKISDDFQRMSRQDLCNHIEKRFGLEHDSFWNLESTQKIRLGCQLARNLKERYK